MKKIIGTVIALVALAAACVALAMTLKLSYYQIKTGSMTPAYPIGTYVIDSGTIPYHKDQPISFVADGEVVTHYFLGYNHDGSLITRGGANPTNDAWNHPVFPKDVRGTVLFQVKVAAPAFLMSREGIFSILGVVLVVIAIIVWPRRPENPSSTPAQSATAG